MLLFSSLALLPLLTCRPVKPVWRPMFLQPLRPPSPNCLLQRAATDPGCVAPVPLCSGTEEEEERPYQPLKAHAN